MAGAPDPASVGWLPWCGEAFTRARAERKPVLLSIVASWARGCVEMDRVSYGDPHTAALINASVVAVRVDADERPDIADRYDLGGFPTTAFLTPDGDLLGGGTFVAPARLCAAVSKVVSAMNAGLPPRGGSQIRDLPPEGGSHTPGGGSHTPEGGSHTPEGGSHTPEGGSHTPGGGSHTPEGGSHTDADDERLIDTVFATFDQRHAGFGDAPKFPLTAPVRLAIDLYAEGHAPAMLDRAVRTLDAVGWGPLYDEAGGGFHRCASHADWTGAQPEKLLATNAALLDLYLYAGQVLGHDRWFARATDLVRYLNGALSSDGRWRVSACADGTRQFTDGNALTVSAMLHAAAIFQDDGLGRHALDAFERVLLSTYKPGHGVAHAAHGFRGLLADQVAMAAASLDAWESTGNIVYRMMAEELMHYTVRTMWDEGGGGCLDRADDGAEPLPPPVKPFVLNCDAAIVLRRLADALDDETFARRADATLEAVRGRAAQFGPLAAHYLLARRAVRR